MKVRACTFEQFHNKNNIGSTKLRVHNLIKYWGGDIALYKYGERPDVLIFQKVYCTPDWKFPINFPGIKILDICDPDWLQGIPLKETMDAMDAITVPTEPLKEFLSQLTDKPVLVIPDRHDLENVPPLKQHKGELKKLVWFGYSHNASVLKPSMKFLEREGYELTIVSDSNPLAERWASPNYKVTFKKHNWNTIYQDLAEADAAILPKGDRPIDRFKSDNKTTLAWLAGLPVVTNLEELEAVKEESARQAQAELCYNKARNEYDVKQSVQEMKDLIDGLIK